MQPTFVTKWSVQMLKEKEKHLSLLFMQYTVLTDDI